MADEIIIKYSVDASEFGKAGVAVQHVNDLLDETKDATKAAFSERSIEEATKKVLKLGNAVDENNKKFGSLKAELRAVTELINSGKLEGKELQRAYRHAGELTDRIGDVRNEIRRLSSDTKLLDTFSQGARGLTAAFSVATGAAAAFGSENENMQKALLKVQGAMAALQGIQEIGKIVTEENNIAMRGYAFILGVVEKISKVTGLSMAASWAVATAGLTILISAVGYLIYSLNEAEEETGQLTAEQQKNNDEIAGLKIAYDKASGSINDYTAKTKALALETNKAIREVKEANDAAVKGVQGGFFNSILNSVGLYGIAAGRVAKKSVEVSTKSAAEIAQINEVARLKQATLDAEEEKRKAEAADKAIKDAFARRKALDAQNKVDNITAFELPDAPPKDKVKEFLKGTQDAINIEKVPEVNVKLTVSKLSVEEAAQKFLTDFSSSLNTIAPTINALQGLTRSIYEGETSVLEQEKEKQLLIAGDNALKREKIEKDFAIKRAKLAREQAIADRSFATFNAIVNLATAISKTIADNGFPAAIPFIALAAATGALQIAAINAAPLPAIPQYEKGGAVVLAGGRMNDGHLFGRSHRDGGMLINAQGGEYIWDIPTVQRHGDIIKAAHENRIEDLVLHKYLVPMMRARNAEPSRNESYDDMLLRSTIRSSNKQMTKDIVNGISKNFNDSIYLTQRYKS